MRTLFRNEAYNALNNVGFGNTTIHQPLGIRVLAVLAFIVVCIFILFMCFGNYTSKAKVSGYLEPTTGLIAVWSPHQGIIKEVYVTAGQPVTRGDPLFIIAPENSSLQTEDTAKKVLNQLQQQKINLEKSIKNEQSMAKMERAKLKSTHSKQAAELEQGRSEIQIASLKVRSQKSILESYKKLEKNHFISKLEAEQAEHKLLDYQSQVEAIRRRIINLVDNVSQAETDITLRELRSQKEQNAIQQAIVRIDQQITEQYQRQASVVLAPTDGTITALPVHKDQMIANKQKLTTLVPKNSRLRATLFIPSKSSGFLNIQQTVIIRYPAFPYQKFGLEKGVIVNIDNSLTIPSEEQLPIKVSEPVYRVSVQLDKQSITAYGKVHPLKAGMALEADIELESRTIIEWLMEPIVGFTKKV